MTEPLVSPDSGRLLNTAEDIAALARVLKSHAVIAFDTEFIRETTFFPTVEIIQVATRDGSWLVDAQAFFGKKRPSASPGLKPLLDIFEDPSILKILHAAQGDQECLYTSFGVVASPTLDTAVAASLCGLGDSMGLGNLLKAVLNVTIKKGHARTNWSVRPLPSQLMEYAHADVEHLVRLGETLMEKLEKLGRKEWALQQSAKWEDRALYEADPEGLSQKLAKGKRMDSRAFAALRELMQWRETRVRELNLPRRWVADDTVLMDLAQVRPKDLGHLGSFRGLNKGELKNSGETILAAIERAAQSKEDVSFKRGPRPDIPTREEQQALDLLKCYLNILADDRQIATRHLIGSADLLGLLRAADAKNAAELVERGALNEGSARLIGEEILAFLRGQRALSIHGNQVKIVPSES